MLTVFFIAQCVVSEEPILLVGETGCGKTSTVQHLAHSLSQPLVVLNLNQQSDSAELLGGFKPVEFELVVTPMKKMFDDLFSRTFSKSANAAFLTHVHDMFTKKKWAKLFEVFQSTIERVDRLIESNTNSETEKTSEKSSGKIVVLN